MTRILGRGLPALVAVGITMGAVACTDLTETPYTEITEANFNPTASDLASSDLHAWIESLHAGLGPGACGQVVDCGSDDCVIIVQWDDSRGSGGSATQQLRTETRL